MEPRSSGGRSRNDCQILTSVDLMPLGLTSELERRIAEMEAALVRVGSGNSVVPFRARGIA